MILLIATGLLFLALVAFSAIKMEKKVMALGGCVILLVLCNFANEIAAASQLDAPRQQVKREQQVVQHLTPAAITVLSNQTVEEKAGELLEEERQMAGYLAKRWEGKEYTLVHFDNLHRNRLRIIMEVLNYRINHTDPHRNIQAYHLDFKNQDCNIRCLRKTVQQLKQDAYMVLIVENIKDSEELSNLQAIYSQQRITIVFQNLPRFFFLHTISRLTYRFPFSNNYLPKLLQQHPSKTIQFCSLYRSFDYNFYATSLTTPLLELCSRPLPSTAAVKCVKKHITEEKMRVPESWVRKCLSQEGQEGLTIQNGWVGLKKEYFWSGRVSKTDLVPEREDL